jgi:hypothetical protein
MRLEEDCLKRLGRRPLPDRLIQEIQNHTGAPWWNGEAYAEYRGYPQKIMLQAKAMRQASADIQAVIDRLRSARLYEHADALREIVHWLEAEA